MVGIALASLRRRGVVQGAMSGDDGAYRKLSELVATERCPCDLLDPLEAESEGWHQLSPAKKARLYRLWEARYRLSTTVKDGIMKGFDVAQGIPASGEAAIHATLLSVLLASSIPYVRSKERRPEWRREVDFVLGFSDRFPHAHRGVRGGTVLASWTAAVPAL